MIKIFSENDIKTDYLENLYSNNKNFSNKYDYWDYPINELNYLLESHPSECFILYKDRLYECDEEELINQNALEKEPNDEELEK